MIHGQLYAHVSASSSLIFKVSAMTAGSTIDAVVPSDSAAKASTGEIFAMGVEDE